MRVNTFNKKYYYPQEIYKLRLHQLQTDPLPASFLPESTQPAGQPFLHLTALLASY